jgi:hypothetical protein
MSDTISRRSSRISTRASQLRHVIAPIQPAAVRAEERGGDRAVTVRAEERAVTVRDRRARRSAP